MSDAQRASKTILRVVRRSVRATRGSFSIRSIGFRGSRRGLARHFLGAAAALALALAGVAMAPPSLAAESKPAQTHALLINGGGAPSNNFLSHLHHLQDMVAALRERGIPPDRIHLFSADGAEPGKDLSTRGSEPPDFWLIEGTSVARVLNPAELSNTVWEGVTLRPARLRELRRWFASMSETLRPGDTLLVFVTDHGTRNTDDPDNGFISLWNETLSVLEFRALLGYLKPGVRVVSVMSQCFSGAFADAMTPLSSKVPSGDICGFYSTTAERMAYGCYPEGRDRDRIGHAFRVIDAMDGHGSLDDVHAAVLVADTSPDVPVRTSDLFLERVLRDESARRKLELDDLVDELLARAWRTGGRWEREIRLLDRMGDVYGTFSPRSLAELKPKIDSLQTLSQELDTYESRWSLALDDLCRDNLGRFVETTPGWKERLDEKTIGGLNAAAKRKVLVELLPALEEYTRGRTEVWARLADLRETHGGVSSAKYRTDVRLAALLRMRALMVRVAGTELVSPDDPGDAGEPGSRERSRRTGEMARGLAGLEACERTTLGTFDPTLHRAAANEAPEPLPPLEEDLEAVERALPSWLGIRFHPASDKERETLGARRGAAVVDQIYADGPAGAAGLRTGDVVLGPPDGHFKEPNQVREWTMSSPRGTPLPLDVERDGTALQVSVSLVPFPTKLPALAPPPKAGDEAPRLAALRMVRPGADAEKDFSHTRHMLFFWATWCGPCKASLPELVAWGRRSGVPVVAVSDENEEVIRTFLGTWTGPFPDLVASDDLRRYHQGFGVSGTPTFVLVDANGKIEWRQVGYSPKTRLAIPGWSWPGATN